MSSWLSSQSVKYTSGCVSLGDWHVDRWTRGKTYPDYGWHHSIDALSIWSESERRCELVCIWRLSFCMWSCIFSYYPYHGHQTLTYWSKLTAVTSRLRLMYTFSLSFCGFQCLRLSSYWIFEFFSNVDSHCRLPWLQSISLFNKFPCIITLIDCSPLKGMTHVVCYSTIQKEIHPNPNL